MKVKELIKELEKYPEDMIVVFPYEDRDVRRYFTMTSFKIKNLEEDWFFMDCWQEPDQELKYQNPIYQCLVME